MEYDSISGVDKLIHENFQVKNRSRFLLIDFLAATLACAGLRAVSAAALSVIGLQSAPAAQAYIEEYIPVSAADKKKKILLKTVSDSGLKDGKLIRIADAEMSLPTDSEDLLFQGRDKAGKPWTLSKTYFGLGSAFFTTDLDKNGTVDIIILQATGGCGIAPNAVLTTIMFDEHGKPHPVETSGYFSCPDPDWGGKAKTAVIDDLIALGPDKRAVLIGQQLDNAEINGRAHSYWRIPMYRANQCRWERLNKYNQNAVPMMVRYTSKGNVKVIPPPVPALRKYEELSSDQTDGADFKCGVIKDIRVEDKRIKRLQIGKDVCIEPDWKYVQPFVISDTKDSFDLMTLDSDKSIALLQKLKSDGTEVRYSAPVKTGSVPRYIMVSR